MGEPMDLTATVTPAPPDGLVSFHRDGVYLGSIAVTLEGTATWTIPWLYPGMHSFSASYGYGTSHAPSTSAPVPVTVFDPRTPVSVSVSTDPNVTLRGDPVIVRVAVTPNPGPGAIHLVSGSSLMGQGMLGDDGIGEIRWTPSATYAYEFNACFAGNAEYQEGCSAAWTHTTWSYPTTTTLEVVPGRVYPDESVTFRVQVTPSPDEDSSVYIGPSPHQPRFWIPLGPAGTGEITFPGSGLDPQFPVGTYELQAYFVGTKHHDASTSEMVLLERFVDTPLLVTTASPQTLAPGDLLTFDASVSPRPRLTDPAVELAFFGPPESGFGEILSIPLGPDGTGRTAVDTSGWPLGEYWYEAAYGGDDRLETVKVRGDFRLRSRVADITPPVGSIAIAGGVPFTNSRETMLTVTASDPESGVSHVSLSNDGVTWLTRDYAQSQSWTLSAGNGKRTVWAKWRDRAGNWSDPVSATIVLDTVAPSVVAPGHRFRAGGTVSTGGAIPVTLAWSGTDATSGIARYELAQSTDGGGYVIVSTSLTAPTVTRSLTPSHSYRFRVRAVDGAGNTGSWSYGPTFRISARQQSSSAIVYSTGWRTSTATSHWGGSAKYATTAGAKATFRFDGRSFAWIAAVGPTRGSARVYVNGVLVKTVSLYASASASRRVVYAQSWGTNATRTVVIRVVGTSGHSRVDIDALVWAAW
jgi:hypothetical protein